MALVSTPTGVSAQAAPAQSAKANENRNWFIAMRLFHLDQLDGFVTGAFYHHRAGVADLVARPEKSDALAFQLGGPGIEIADAETDMIHQMSLGRRQQLVRLVHVPVHRHIIETDAAGGKAIGAFLA